MKPVFQDMRGHPTAGQSRNIRCMKQGEGRNVHDENEPTKDHLFLVRSSAQ